MLWLILAMAASGPGWPQDASTASPAPNTASTPPDAPGTILELLNFDGRPSLRVTVESVTPKPVLWTDAVGVAHTERTVIYVDPQKGRLITTWNSLLNHRRRPLVSVPVRDLPFAGVTVGPPPPAPRSNQSIRDGIARPRDTILAAPLTQTYYRETRP